MPDLRTLMAKQLHKLLPTWSNQAPTLMSLPQAQVLEKTLLQELVVSLICKLSQTLFKFLMTEPSLLGQYTQEMPFAPFQLVIQLEFWQSELPTLTLRSKVTPKIILLKIFKGLLRSWEFKQAVGLKTWSLSLKWQNLLLLKSLWAEEEHLKVLRIFLFYKILLKPSVNLDVL